MTETQPGGAILSSRLELWLSTFIHRDLQNNNHNHHKPQTQNVGCPQDHRDPRRDKTKSSESQDRDKTKSSESQDRERPSPLKISFNESSLHSTYEYPSETSAWDSEEEDERGESPEEQPSMVGRIHIPRAQQPSNANDLSNYIPKHAVDYSTWQEQREEENTHREETSPQPAHTTDDIMVRPKSTTPTQHIQTTAASFGKKI
ncbi:hypothetical protein WMY93_022163 [Mugilogobius chulae]|uniref:Phostensin/Taperin PP1-binding domain-containing protein n=1 Tax=Mugilogobius chulae TaxID=88201 RepID=A0AAW0NPU2_9GOBI